jgi:uncharacterized protein
MEDVKEKSKRGFASMDPEKVKELASKGGKAAHRAGNAHEFTTAEAKVAGRKGGLKARRKLFGGDPATAPLVPRGTE